jgi:hypothetical protein
MGHPQGNSRSFDSAPYGRFAQDDNWKKQQIPRCARDDKP